MMRIITGRARGCKLYTLEGENTRPTTERVKEAIYSMIQFEIEGRHVLDLFAGSGQMGLEAVSRGAEHADLVDLSKDAVAVIKKNQIKTKLALETAVYQSNAADFLRHHRGRGEYDLVFLDPPYGKKLIPEMLSLLLKYELLKPTSIIVCESGDFSEVFDQEEGLRSRFTVRKEVRYGSSYVTILEVFREEE